MGMSQSTRSPLEGEDSGKDDTEEVVVRTGPPSRFENTSSIDESRGASSRSQSMQWEDGEEPGNGLASDLHQSQSDGWRIASEFFYPVSSTSATPATEPESAPWNLFQGRSDPSTFFQAFSFLGDSSTQHAGEISPSVTFALDVPNERQETSVLSLFDTGSGVTRRSSDTGRSLFAWDEVGWQTSTTTRDETTFQELAALATRAFLPAEVADALIGGESSNTQSPAASVVNPLPFTAPEATTHSWLPSKNGIAEMYEQQQPDIGPIMVPRSRRASNASSISDDDDESRHVPDFLPPFSRHYEWMGRSVETLVLGHQAKAHILVLPDEGDDDRTEETPPRCSRRGNAIGSDFQRRRSSMGSTPGSRRGSLSLLNGQGGAAHSPMHGGTLANYYNQRHGQASTGNMDMERNRPFVLRRNSPSLGPNCRRRNSGNHTNNCSGTDEGPNVVFSILAREVTGKPTSLQSVPPTQRLKAIGGRSLYATLDKPAGGIISETVLLEYALNRGDWTETQTLVSRLAPRLIGDPSISGPVPGSGGRGRSAIDDHSLPTSAPLYHAGGGRLGFERDAFVLAGGVELFLRVFAEQAFVGDELCRSNDARDLSEDLVGDKLAGCWNEVLASLRELVYALPALVENGTILNRGDFIPFLFTLLAHDSCFDGAAALIEEILSLQSHSPVQAAPTTEDEDIKGNGNIPFRETGYVAPTTTFFLGNVPDLYDLWGNFNCRQLAHFCRLLALLVFEPEDRQILESPAVLKSMELLQLRRDRAARAGRDSSVDMNQAILLGDPSLVEKLLQLLRIMNFSPTLKRSSAYHVMAHFPFIADTLVMLGLSEMDNWDDINRLENLAREMLSSDYERGSTDYHDHISEIGSVADMLESLSGLLLGNPLEPATQLGHIIHVINAAQQAGVVVGRQRNGRTRRRQTNSLDTERDSATRRTAVGTGGMTATGDSVEDMASTAFALPVVLETSPSASDTDEIDPDRAIRIFGIGVDGAGGTSFHQYRAGGLMRINTPEDAANELQFNALLLAPYQVEVLFVLCTLLGGRRKIDTQVFLRDHGLIAIMDDMFHRLSWGAPSSTPLSVSRQPLSNAVSENRDGLDARPLDPTLQMEQPNGIHGPGCECTPESALSVQYLRLLHNFCDRDCDNYTGRRLLLSPSERRYIFAGTNPSELKEELKPGLFSKIIKAFIREPDDSPYRFWLASCAESYLRGSSPPEQLFAASTGLLNHLVEEIISDRLHCAGSLQTSFDLLGELCKGNADVLGSLMSGLNEDTFRKLMGVAAANLVDSNVFIRSLFLSVERISASEDRKPLLRVPGAKWKSRAGLSSRFYLTHSWWDSCLNSLMPKEGSGRDVHPVADCLVENEKASDDARPSDWFPPFCLHNDVLSNDDVVAVESSTADCICINPSVGYYGWTFSPVTVQAPATSLSSDWVPLEAAYMPNRIERLTWFLATNQARLLRDLLRVVDLRNVNHENICCLNTAIVVAIFANRRNQLPRTLHALRQMNDDENAESEQGRKNTAKDCASWDTMDEQAVDKTFIQAMKFLKIDGGRRESLERHMLSGSARRMSSTATSQTDLLRNFRELLWFWSEYYTHRGRDRLSLEFSSHLRFQEWKNVVEVLGADDGSSTSLVRSLLRLPKSPYKRAARMADSHLRGA